MLKTAVSPLIALALICAGSAGCIPKNPPVKPIPGGVVGVTKSDALLISNATGTPLTLLPSKLHASDPEVVLAPGQSKQLEFSLIEEKNRGSNVTEILLTDNSSHYLRQPETDLVIRVRFGASRAAKEIRIAIGECLLRKQPPAGGHPVQVDRLPSPGIPFVELCSN